MRAVAGKCAAAEKLFSSLNLSALRSGLYNNPFDYNHLQEKYFSEIYRKTP